MVYNFVHMLQPRQGEKLPSDIRVIKPFSESYDLRQRELQKITKMSTAERHDYLDKKKEKRTVELKKVVGIYKDAVSHPEGSKARVVGFARGNDSLLRLFLRQSFQGSLSEIGVFFKDFSNAVAAVDNNVAPFVQDIEKSILQLASRIEGISQSEIDQKADSRTIFATSVNLDAELAVDLIECVPVWKPGKEPQLVLDFKYIQAKGISTPKREDVDELPKKAKKVIDEFEVDEDWFVDLLEERGLAGVEAFSEQKMLDMVVNGEYEEVFKKIESSIDMGEMRDFLPIVLYHKNFKIRKEVNTILEMLDPELVIKLPCIVVRKNEFRCLLKVAGQGDVEMSLQDAIEYWDRLLKQKGK